MLWDCLDIFTKTHEDALSVHSACFVSSISSLVFSFFLCFSRDLYFLLLCTHWSIFFSLPTPLLFPAALCAVRKRRKGKKKKGKRKDNFFFLSTFLLYRWSLPSSAGWSLALSCLNCCSLSQDVPEIKFSGAQHVSFVSSLFAWEGATHIYGTAVVVMVTAKERQSAWAFLCWNFVLFRVLIKQSGLGGSTEGH